MENKVWPGKSNNSCTYSTFEKLITAGSMLHTYRFHPRDSILMSFFIGSLLEYIRNFVGTVYLPSKGKLIQFAQVNPIIFLLVK